ncbi:uncharacterized protein LAESUDRAFT_714070 [Laetiporus sulphureus 93-53]|uniref:Uncharacterized protein n=1 Tax=Laetiporus sulphureus 93-53 TaxID=1314785 RepID=A0A165EAN4_9APHY|nr:uncharacterized protein LAESUDRAFT_714070 [Laetiporus sulphureus 93-53]KZT06604.1 hypothetical protein LAESUDRAFT_714070 [Laetiporus sulphureus 93-53]
MEILNESICADTNGDDDRDGLMRNIHIDNVPSPAPGLSEKCPPMTKSCFGKAHVHEVTSKIVSMYSEIPSCAVHTPSNVRSHGVKVDTEPSQVKESPAPLVYVIKAEPTTTLYTIEQHFTPLPLTPFIQPMSPSGSSKLSQQCSCHTGIIMLGFTDDIKKKVLVPSLDMYADYYMPSHGYTYRAWVEVVAVFANSCNREDFVTCLRGADVPSKHLKFMYFLCKNHV